MTKISAKNERHETSFVSFLLEEHRFFFSSPFSQPRPLHEKKNALSHYSVSIKGPLDGDAVLCTREATFDLKTVETTNSLLLVPDGEVRKVFFFFLRLFFCLLRFSLIVFLLLSFFLLLPPLSPRPPAPSRPPRPAPTSSSSAPPRAGRGSTPSWPPRATATTTTRLRRTTTATAATAKAGEG